jgi:hypothetical protein
MVQPVMTGEPSFIRTPAPMDAEFPVMAHPVIRAADPMERIPPPACVARLSVMVQWVMTGDPFSTKIPAPRKAEFSLMTQFITVGDEPLHLMAPPFEEELAQFLMVKPDMTEPSFSPEWKLNPLALFPPSIMHFPGPFSDLTVISFPLKSRFTLPAPVWSRPER